MICSIDSSTRSDPPKQYRDKADIPKQYREDARESRSDSRTSRDDRSDRDRRRDDRDDRKRDSRDDKRRDDKDGRSRRTVIEVEERRQGNKVGVGTHGRSSRDVSTKDRLGRGKGKSPKRSPSPKRASRESSKTVDVRKSDKASR